MKDVLLSALNGIVFNRATVPVCRLKYSGKQKTYITFYMLSDNADIYADNEEQERTIHFTVDIWTNNSDFDKLTKNVRSRLKNAGFIITATGPELFEKETQTYHIPIDCSIENLEEE